MKLKFAIIALFLSTTLAAEKLPIGGWRTHLAYTSTQIIAQSESKIYAISNGALYAVGKDDNSIELLSKISGLNDNNVASIGYSDTEKTLVITYNNANIDLLTEYGIENIRDVYTKNMSGSKTANQVFCYGKFAYLACPFGILKIDLERKEVTDTYIIGDNGATENVLSIEITDNKIYALTPSSLKFATLTGKNLANFENWSKIATPSGKPNQKLALYDNKFFVLKADSTVYRYDGSWSKTYEKITDISGDKGSLFVCEEFQFFQINSQGKRTFNNAGIRACSIDSETGDIWAAASEAGIAQMTNDGLTNVFCPNGPIDNCAWQLKYADGRMYAVPGGRWAVQNSRPGHVMIFDGENWKNIRQQEMIQFAPVSNRQLTPQDFVSIAIDPKDNTHFYAASYGLGIYEFRNDKFYKLYNADNSNVESIFPEQKPEHAYYYYHRTDGLTYDKNGRLWYLTAAANRGTLKYIKNGTDGEIVSLNHKNINDLSTPQDIIISDANDQLKWILVPRVDGNKTALIAVFDNGTDAVNDDQIRIFYSLFDQDGNNYTPANFRCIAQDKNKQLWIGSNDGICVISSQTKAFNEDFRCTRVKIPRNDGTNLADYLLDGVQINAITIDGSNRKWIGTETNGVFLMSEDGLETIEHFTSENSPLLSDKILSIGINERTGEVFFGTGNGICSYQSDASEGNEQFTDVHAFPNPVREDYSGVITITGLMENSRVKITDIAGNVVYETMSNGGIATWDGNRQNGRRVATGVYLAMCFSSDGKQHATTKILVINR